MLGEGRKGEDTIDLETADDAEASVNDDLESIRKPLQISWAPILKLLSIMTIP